ncbi:hypothetical protein DFA_05704 [Cavenderia fasciculata]|uniref:Uncharacterized protein n=1 Tax=Cavenderia fasciculata TaxID=261658 RepID=F4PM71_CACFS|nr:uncharacterized protein DFA_05704 [Cavenderia fasciculata]EGG23571.1 hypothetical protein DFA_05704 [Cavenderia fasciculata]|eukprot:XP_004361422.1 hypothetical protein DFA_05704 [Cavenderia fasciculata]
MKPSDFTPCNRHKDLYCSGDTIGFRQSIVTFDFTLLNGCNLACREILTEAYKKVIGEVQSELDYQLSRVPNSNGYFKDPHEQEG